MAEDKIRILVAKPGLDGHDRGAKVVARALRDAGFEVIYSGLHQTPEEIVSTALQEDVDIVGLSILSGAHMTLIPKIREMLKEKGAGDITILGGGTIPDDEKEELLNMGAADAIFTPGTSTEDIVNWINENVKP
ncbi:cobalamin B12-binding domain-containing protein [Natranaerofaba carboxydovora]|uniref:cobalamin B12-binding domain-containing protein n=1 Tax=Natranaerofaba carboxydovora TaxID=2742683 RepID=UPI001F14405F|nr:cobalamin B12-binding domain-containing protein [Natranaerofaba carboxydovora]UMZ74612.1 Methylmalonyl-CoA mutase [Natranaerofaba carboxydovora]